MNLLPARIGAMAGMKDKKSISIALPAAAEAAGPDLSHTDPFYLAGGAAADSGPAAPPDPAPGGSGDVNFDDFAPRWWPYPPLS
jgi:hypothetical protein